MLRLLGLFARALGVRAAVKAVVVRVGTTLLLLWLTAVFTAIALGFGVSAGYAYLASELPPAAAAALCAGIGLLIAVAIAVVNLRRLRSRRVSRGPTAGADAELAPALVRLLEWGRANPTEAVAAALIIGLLAGRRRS